jgi:hypothetical protein
MYTETERLKIERKMCEDLLPVEDTVAKDLEIVKD